MPGQSTNAELEDLLRRLGLIEAGYSGPVEVTASTDEGSDTVTITV